MSTLTTSADAAASATPTLDPARRLGIVAFGRKVAATIIAVSAACNTAEAVLSHYDGEAANEEVGSRLTAIAGHHHLDLVATVLGTVAALLMPSPPAKRCTGRRSRGGCARSSPRVRRPGLPSRFPS